MQQRYGAAPEDWAHLVSLGLRADLLPVVSNPTAKISPGSKMKALGKTPSRYNGHSCVAGIPDWTSYEATDDDIRQWSEVPDYGICVQCRHVRGIDIDIVDPELAQRVVAFTDLYFGEIALPLRFRSNSPKCLFAFKAVGEQRKSVVKLQGGIIEILADGQMFVGFGTHPSGVRYEWDWQGLEDFPILTLGEIDAYRDALAKEFGASVETGAGTRKNEAPIEIDDPVLAKLQVLSWGRNGEANIECPFKAGHTMNSGETETRYFPAGTRGYERGHFKCLHAHCEGKSDTEFMDALGITAGSAEDFECLPPLLPSTDVTALPVPFSRLKNGRLKATIDNVCMAFERPGICGFEIAHDRFRDEDMRQPPGSTMAWEEITDNDFTTMQRHLEKKNRFEPIGYQTLTRAISSVAANNSFDSAQDWLNGVPWDGVQRVDTFAVDVLGADPAAYPRAVSRYIWSALAGRIIKPGVKADMMLILQGDEGLMKSSVISALVPDEQYFTTLRFDEDEKELARKMRGKLVAEIAELRGLNSKDIEGIKDFIVRQVEEWIPKFKEKRTCFRRRLLFFGTTNDETFLPSEGKNRRFLPLKTGVVNLERLESDKLQYWAEGRELYRSQGVLWKDAETLAPSEHKKFTVEPDSWSNYVGDWLASADGMDGSRPCDREYLRAGDVLRDALNIDARSLKGYEGKRIGRILRSMGYENRLKRIDGGKPQSVWMKDKNPGSDLV